MRSTALEDYVARLDPHAQPIVRVLDQLIMNARPDFDTAIRYKILMYALAGDFRTFVCALDVTKRGVALRFLYGVMLDDPLHVLRGGSSVLMTWDFPFNAAMDPSAVGAYVAEAVAKYGDYKTNRAAVQEVAMAAAKKAGRRPKAKPEAGL